MQEEVKLYFIARVPNPVHAFQNQFFTCPIKAVEYITTLHNLRQYRDFQLFTLRGTCDVVSIDQRSAV